MPAPSADRTAHIPLGATSNHHAEFPSIRDNVFLRREQQGLPPHSASMDFERVSTSNETEEEEVVHSASFSAIKQHFETPLKMGEEVKTVLVKPLAKVVDNETEEVVHSASFNAIKQHFEKPDSAVELKSVKVEPVAKVVDNFFVRLDRGDAELKSDGHKTVEPPVLEGVLDSNLFIQCDRGDASLDNDESAERAIEGQFDFLNNPFLLQDTQRAVHAIQSELHEITDHESNEIVEKVEMKNNDETEEKNPNVDEAPLYKIRDNPFLSAAQKTHSSPPKKQQSIIKAISESKDQDDCKKAVNPFIAQDEQAKELWNRRQHRLNLSPPSSPSAKHERRPTPPQLTPVHAKSELSPVKTGQALHQIQARRMELLKDMQTTVQQRIDSLLQ